MAAIDKVSNPVLDALKEEVKKLVWEAYEDIKDEEIPIHLSIFKIPVSFSVKISELREVLVLIAGEEPSSS